MTLANFNLELFRARAYHNLEHGSITAENWERAVAEAVNGEWVQGTKYLADVYDDTFIYSIKSRKVEPQAGPRIGTRDFITHPDFYHHGGLKPVEIDLSNIHTIAGRTSITDLDDQTCPPEDIGKRVLERYQSFEEASLKRFNRKKTKDVVIIHGLSHDSQNYLLRIMFFDHVLNPIVKWDCMMFDGPRTKWKGKRGTVIGYDKNGPHIGRNPDIGRANTAMIRFYRKSEALHLIDTQVPIPKPPEFDFDRIKKIIK